LVIARIHQDPSKSVPAACQGSPEAGADPPDRHSQQLADLVMGRRRAGGPQLQ